MAKMFYNTAEAAQKLGVDESNLKEMVRAGKLREFRDGASFNYKIEEVDRLAKATGATPKAPPPSASTSGEIILEPAEDSGIELAGTGSDMFSLGGTDAGGSAGGTASSTASGTRAAQKAKGDTVVPSVGVNVFDDDELDEHVDPLAQTAVTDVGGLGLEGIGSGSGILDLTRESDDTSLGQELLEEIYTDDDEKDEQRPEPVGEKTRAGMVEAVPAGAGGSGFETEAIPAAAPGRGAIREVVMEYGPDALSTSLTAVMVVTLAVMWIAGLATAALVRGVTPGLIQTLYGKLWIFAAASLGVAAIVGIVTYLVSKKRSG
jgi:hypothetical protein